MIDLAQNRRRAVECGVINFLSVSSVTAFDPSQEGGCPRAWNFRYVQNIKKPDTAATAQGGDIHAAIERYYRTGEDMLTPIVRVGKHYMPPRGDDLRIEFKCDERDATLTAAGIPFRLSIDLAHRRELFIDTAGETRPDPKGTVEVIDWKTTSSISSWAKQGPSLIDTVQMAGYAETMSRLDPSIEHARLSHVYFQTRGKKIAEKRTALFLIETVKHRWQGVEQVVSQMIDVAREPDALRVDGNYSSCGAFGGCFYRDRCPRSTEAVLVDLFGKGKGMSLLAALKSQTGLTGGSSPTPSAVATHTAPVAPAAASQIVAASTTRAVPAAVTGAQSVDMADRRARIEAEMRALQEEEAAAKGTPPPAPVTPAVSAPSCPLCGEVFTVQNVSRLPDSTLFHVGCPKRQGVNPPDAARSTPATVAAVVPPEVIPTLPPAVAAAAQAHAQAVAAAAPIYQATVAPTAPPPAAAAATPAANEKPARKTRKPKAAPAEPQPDTGLVLFVDVIPVKGLAPESLDDYIDNTCEALAEACGVADIRFGHDESGLGFGKWRGALAAAVKASPPPSGEYIVHFVGDSEIKQVVVEALTSIATLVVRGR